MLNRMWSRRSLRGHVCCKLSPRTTQSEFAESAGRSKVTKSAKLPSNPAVHWCFTGNSLNFSSAAVEEDVQYPRATTIFAYVESRLSVQIHLFWSLMGPRFAQGAISQAYSVCHKLIHFSGFIDSSSAYRKSCRHAPSHQH